MTRRCIRCCAAGTSKPATPSAGGAALVGGAVPIPSAAAQWVDLEDGVQVLFDEVNEATYRTGDYWLIPARVATGNVVWPLEAGTGQQLVPVAKPPDGIDHHYAPAGDHHLDREWLPRRPSSRVVADGFSPTSPRRSADPGLAHCRRNQSPRTEIAS